MTNWFSEEKRKALSVSSDNNAFRKGEIEGEISDRGNSRRERVRMVKLGFFEGPFRFFNKSFYRNYFKFKKY